jgi:hypothetical protein
MFRFINRCGQEFSLKAKSGGNACLVPFLVMLNPMAVRTENDTFAYLLSYPFNRRAMMKHIPYVELFFIMVLVMEI